MMVECKNCEHEIMEFSKDKKNWKWKHKSGFGQYAIFDNKCLGCSCTKPEPFAHSDDGEKKQ